jgi:pimeloyl-ACP methyl ester carboxylesterase
MLKTYRFNQSRSRVASSVTKILLIVVLVIITVSSCKKDNTDSKYTYFVSKELVLTYSSTYINGLITNIAGIYPEINNIKSKFGDAVKVDRIIYKTTVGDKEIEASGLLCLPDAPGDYPVICFQNGTNTVNAYAPTMFVTNTPYQLVEVVASMGFAVVIPDYPGFGTSSQIPHPYLIAEPTVTSIVDLLYAVKEIAKSDIPGITLKNEYYLIGYSQGGWATMALHKALETNYSGDFTLGGSVCGAGPYDINFLFQSMIGAPTYPMPVYLGYIVNAYKAYNQFTNPVTDILNEPYASRLNSLFTGLLTSDQINAQLTTSIPGLITSDFITGFATSSKYSSVRAALINNSIAPWHTLKPLYMLHGGSDTDVNPAVTTYFYNAMIAAGTSSGICTKETLPGLNHGDGVAPCMIKGLQFILNLASNN